MSRTAHDALCVPPTAGTRPTRLALLPAALFAALFAALPVSGEAAARFTVRLPLALDNAGSGAATFALDGCVYTTPATPPDASAEFTLPDAGNGTARLFVPGFALSLAGASSGGCTATRTVPSRNVTFPVERLDDGTAFIRYGYTSTPGDSPLVNLFGTGMVSDTLFLSLHYCAAGTPSETCPFPTGQPHHIEVELQYQAVNQGQLANTVRARSDVSGPVPSPPATAPGSVWLLPEQVSTNPVRLSWALTSGGAPLYYTVHVGTAPGVTNVAVFDVGIATAHVAELPPGQRLYVRVTATNVHGSATSNEIDFTIPGTTPPGQPLLSATQVAVNPITLSWTPGGGPAPLRYFIQAGTTAGGSNLGTFAMGTGTSVTAAVPVGLPLFVRVVAQNGSGSVASNEVSFTVAPPAPPMAPVLAAPVVTGTTVAFSWTSATPGVTHTLIARSTPGGPVIAAIAAGAATSFVVGGVPIGTYAVSVAAGNAAGTTESAPVVFSVVPPPPPAPPTLQGTAGQGTVSLSWTAGEPGSTYTLVVRAAPVGAPIMVVPLGTATTLSAGGVPAGTYYVSLVASRGGVNSAESNQLTLAVF